MITMLVQVNGKHVSSINVSESAGRDSILSAARKAAGVKSDTPATLVPGKLVNFALSNP